MPSIHKAALSLLRNELVASHRRDPGAKIDQTVLDRIVVIVGDSRQKSSAALAAELKAGNLPPTEKLALARQGLSATERQDILTLLADPQLAPMLNPAAENFLKALVGLEPLNPLSPPTPIDALAGTTRVDTMSSVPPSPALRAVMTMRQLVESGQLKQYYRAITGEVDDPALAAKAMDLFQSLPKLTAATTADDMVAAGLWTTKPRGTEEMQRSARYLPGRQVLVETTVHSNVFDDRSLLSYKADGVKARTHRASLVGEDGDNFLVKIDGKDDPISVPKEEIYKLNQPHILEGDGVQLSVPCDYDDPLVKAKLAEAAIKMDSLVSELDFTKLMTAPAQGAMTVFGRGRKARKMHDIQRACVKVVHDVIDMRYPRCNDQQPGRVSGGAVGRQAIKGRGVCFKQASVMAALLNPFTKMLGVDVQFIMGSTYREIQSPDENPFVSGGHGWLQLTYRPSMEHRICDRTWCQPDMSMDKAYSRYGDRYPGGFYSAVHVAPVAPTDINFSGDVSVATFERQFGVQGVDGREHHMKTVVDDG